MIKQVYSLIGNVEDYRVRKVLEEIARLAITQDEMKEYVSSQIEPVKAVTDRVVSQQIVDVGGDNQQDFNPGD